MANTDYIDVFYDLAELICAVNGHPVVSKLGITKKLQNGKVKPRLMLGCLQSGVNAMTWQLERFLLTALLDVANDSLDMMAACLGDEVIEYMVLDYTDAFYKLPLRPEERKSFLRPTSMACSSTGTV